MSGLGGAKVGILGTGRSGLSAAAAVAHGGGEAILLDERAVGEAARALIQERGYRLHEGSIGALGLDMLVVSPGVPQTSPIVQEAEAEGLAPISEIELAYRVAKAPILAITGTNGKSTTTVMAYLCALEAGMGPILCGNIFGSGYDEVPLTEAAISASADQLLVAEVSSYQLERVPTFRPVSAGITNIWPDHLDRYGGQFSRYAAAKHNIFRNMSSSDYAVVKAHDPAVIAPKGPKVLTFGSGGEHGLVTEDGLVLLGRRVSLAELPFAEPHNYQNAAMASLLVYGAMRARRERGIEPDRTLLNQAEEADRAARAARKSVYRRDPEPDRWVMPEPIIQGLKNFRGLRHRMELVGERDGVRIINNSMCTNVDAILKSAQSLKEPKHLLVGGVNKGLDFKPLRNYLANGQNWVYVYGRDRAQISEMLGGQVPVSETLQEAFSIAVGAARSGQVVMLSPGCASQDQFADFRDRGDVFTKLAKDWLES